MRSVPNSLVIGSIVPLTESPVAILHRATGDSDFLNHEIGERRFSVVKEMLPGFFIEKDVPIPERRSTATGLAKGLIVEMKKMEVGDSIFVPHARGGDRTIQNVVGHVTTATGWKFTRRVVDGGARVWRVQ